MKAFFSYPVRNFAALCLTLGLILAPNASLLAQVGDSSLTFLQRLRCAFNPVLLVVPLPGYCYRVDIADDTSAAASTSESETSALASILQPRGMAAPAAHVPSSAEIPAATTRAEGISSSGQRPVYVTNTLYRTDPDAVTRQQLEQRLQLFKNTLPVTVTATGYSAPTYASYSWTNPPPNMASAEYVNSRVSESFSSLALRIDDIEQNQQGTSSPSQWADGIAGISYTGGNVGIGTTTPPFTLTVAMPSGEQAFFVTSSGAAGNSTANPLDATGVGLTPRRFSWEVPGAGSGWGARFSNAGTGNFKNVLFLSAASTSTFSYILSAESGGVSRFIVKANGRVGINTAAPSSMLDIRAMNGDTDLFSVTSFNNNPSLVVRNTGLVGIGTGNPDARLHVLSAATNAATLVAQATTSQAASVLDVRDSTGISLLNVLPGGNVGMGTASPNHLLEVSHAGTADFLGVGAFFAPNNTTAGYATQLKFGVSNTMGNSAEWRYVHQGSDNNANRIDFGFNGYASPVLSYNKAGNVGIGTTTPAQKLSVAGGMRLTGAFFDGANTSGTAGMVLQTTGTGTQWVATSSLGISGGESSQWTTSGSDIYYDAGKVAVGTTTAWDDFTVSLNGGKRMSMGADSNNYLAWGFTSGGYSSVPSYANAGGTGNRTSLITVSGTLTLAVGAPSRLVNGDISANAAYFTNNESVAGKYLVFDFGVDASKVITEARFYQNPAISQGTFNWQGSNDGNTWTDIGSSFVLGGNTVQTITTLSENTTGYRYYRILGLSGTTNWNSYIHQFEFQIDDFQTATYASGQTYSIDGVSAAGTVALQSSGGSVGIGTVSALSKLDVNGNVSIGSYAGTIAAPVNGLIVSGNVGIGTTTPASKLSVAGSAFIGGDLVATGSITFGNFNMNAVATCGQQYHTFIGSIGDVGGDQCAALNVTQQDTNGNVIYRFGGVGQAWAGEFYANSSLVGMNTKGGIPLSFQIGQTEAMRVATNGNVGIGTTTPAYKLDVNGDIGRSGGDLVMYAGVKDNSSLWFRTGTSANYTDEFVINGAANTISLGGNDLLLSSGRIGIGTTTPASKLHVFSGEAGPVVATTTASLVLESASSNFLQFMNPGAAASGVFFGHGNSGGTYRDGAILYNYVGPSNSLAFYADGVDPRMIITGTGNVGIGTTTPTEKLDVVGGIRASSPSGNIGVSVHYSGSGGREYQFLSCSNCGTASLGGLEVYDRNASAGRAYIAAGVNGWQTPSDRRLKKDIETLSVLDRLGEVRGATYVLRDSDIKQIGVIAQEIRDAFPEAVSGEEIEGRFLGVSYDAIATIALQGVKEIADLSSAFKNRLIGWFADASNGIGKLFVGEVRTEKLCVGDTCVTEAQLQALLLNASLSQAQASGGSSAPAAESGAQNDKNDAGKEKPKDAADNAPAAGGKPDDSAPADKIKDAAVISPPADPVISEAGLSLPTTPEAPVEN